MTRFAAIVLYGFWVKMTFLGALASTLLGHHLFSASDDTLTFGGWMATLAFTILGTTACVIFFHWLIKKLAVMFDKIIGAKPRG